MEYFVVQWEVSGSLRKVPGVKWEVKGDLWEVSDVLREVDRILWEVTAILREVPSNFIPAGVYMHLEPPDEPNALNQQCPFKKKLLIDLQ
ncbi:hypothetical protein [Sporosarcina highlanderae]|uniref:Uncharacterized protein n=1 Tax=Sporosarcina highlanderae TaxID=3035916 RepID=A0ABT8JQX3_9BACL|nr:hypothetical protein [Sporosarcina highlanderae]MDN4606812.1 hypothetical protein [Sporosarcina highlanderae]